MQVHDHVVTLPRTKRSGPKINENRKSNGTADDGGGIFQGTGSHSNNDDGKYVSGIERIAEDVTKTNDGKNGHQAESRDEIVREHHHDEGNDGGNDDERVYEGARIRKARVGPHVNPGDRVTARKRDEQSQHHGRNVRWRRSK